MKYSIDLKDKTQSNYYFNAIQSPHRIENALKDLFKSIGFIKKYHIKLRIDKDGLYSFYKDSIIVNLVIDNSNYVVHLLEDVEKIEDIVRSWIPMNFDVHFDISYKDY